MSTKSIIYSSRDIKALMEMVENKFLEYYIHSYSNSKNDFLAVKCDFCKLYISDKNSGRLLFNVRIHLKLKHGVEV
jgi:hypothetical protein